MALVLKAGQGFLYMKVGNHAQEPLDAILERKTKEITDAGFAFWGYGGNTCHPQTMVQPFARSYEQRGGVIYLCMEPMTSNHIADPLRAKEYSVDGVSWKVIHPKVHVLGSRYALVIKNLREEKFNLPLSKTRVALGNSMGIAGSKYVAGRVDKACLEATEDLHGDPTTAEDVHIGLVADVIDPYAVYVRG